MPLTTLDPCAALVVVDLQNGVMGADTTPLATGEVLERNVRLVDAFRARELPVVLVRTTGLPPGRTDERRDGHEPSRRPEGWDALRPELTTGPHHVVTKRAWGAFHDTGLHEHLRERGVTQVVVTGIATSLGVESTARAAHERGYHVSVATDAIADQRAESHEHSVSRIFPRLGETGTTAELLELLGDYRAP